MILPIGMDETRVARWPVVTFTLAVLTLGISGSVAWHSHLSHNGTWFENVNAYWHDHPDLEPTDACAPYLTPPQDDNPGLPRPRHEPGDPRKFATLCLHAMDERTANQPLWLVRADQGLVQVGTLTHGLAFPNVPATLVGLLLLVFVLGSFLEDRWGRDRFAAFWLLATVVTAVAYRRSALPGADPLAGGNALSAACLGAFTVTFGKRRIQYALLGLGGSRHFFAPAWSVALVWLVAHVAVLAWSEGRTPADSTAEFAGFGVGIAVGLVGRWQKWRAEDVEVATPTAEPAWVKSSVAPVKATPDAKVAAAPETSRAAAPAAAPMFDDVTTESTPPFADFPLFDDAPRSKPAASVPDAVPLEAEGGWARFALDEPALPPRRTAQLEPPEAPRPVADAPAVALVPAPAHATPLTRFEPPPAQVAPWPPRDPLATPYWTLEGRDSQGLLLHDEDGVPMRLDPRHLLAVAVGVVQTVDVGMPGPALIIDLVLDSRPPRCVRMRPSAEALAKSWPGETRQDAVLALARHLASGGALRIPQVPEWPGPPWTTYPDTRALMAQWQQALAKH